MILTRTEAKNYLGLGIEADAILDPILDAIIAGAGDAMKREALRCFESTSITEVLDGEGQERLYLRESPESVTSVYESSDQEWSASNLVATDDYLLRGCALERLDGVWLNASAAIQVVYLGGFAAMPEAVKDLCRQQVAWMYSNWQAAKQGKNVLRAEGVEGWTQQFADHTGLDPNVKVALARYRPARL